MKEIILQCKKCGKDYDMVDLKRSVSDTWWINKYCSSQCYTKFMTQVKKEYPEVKE